MYSSISQFFTQNISTGRLLRGRVAVLLVNLAILAVTPTSRALLPPPPPDGGYPGYNTAEGDDALFDLTTGTSNTAVGWSALHNNTSGGNNTAIGRGALLSNRTGTSNTATGFQALVSNGTGGFNTASGFNALFSNYRGSFNTAAGSGALYGNTTAFFNTATGYRALYTNTAGLSNTATGYQALYLNAIGGQNTANGVQALYRTTGGSNIALGYQAGVNLTTGNNNIAIGNAGVAGESGKIRIGTKGTHDGTFIAGVYGTTISSGAQVIIGSGGKLGTIQSSARYKEAIKPMDKASEAILALQPVTFRYKQDLDPDGIPQFGLVAEQVEKVNPDLVVRGEDGQVMTVRYEAVNAMLLNEFLKEHGQVQQLKAIVAQQQQQIETLAAGLQNVTAQVDATNAAQRVASR